MSPDDTNWPLPRRLAIGYAIAIAALIVNAVFTFANLNSIRHTWDTLQGGRDFVRGIDDVLSNLRDAESGQRDYLLTGEESFLEPFTRSNALLDSAIARLRSQAGEDQTRLGHLKRVADASDTKLRELAETTAIRRDKGLEAAIAAIQTRQGKDAMDHVRAELAAMRADENITRAILRQRLQTAIGRTTVTFTLASSLALALLFGVHLLSERSRLDLRRHVTWLSTTLRSIGDGVVATDGSGRITFLNPAAENLTGWTREAANGMPIAEVVRITDRESGQPVGDSVERVLREGIVIGISDQTRVVARDGTSRPVFDIAAPIKDLDGRIQGAVYVLHDVTDKLAAEVSQLESKQARQSADVAMRRAEHTRQALAAIVESSDDAIISQSLDGIITSWNAGAERILGYTADEIVGKQVAVLRPPTGAEDIASTLQQIREGKRIEHFETRRLTKDRRIIDVSVSVSPIRDADGTIVGASKVARDITERKRSQKERERLLAAAESANRMKDEFLATLSHELRTPLNAIVGWASILRSAKVDPSDMEEGLSAIERNSRAQAVIIDDLLDISRIISGNLRLDVQRLNLSEIIDTAIAAVLPAATAKDIRIHKMLDSLVGPLAGDPARLQQVIWNLLTNAVKFTPRSGNVHVLLERVNSHIEISVVDTGQGIKPEFLPNVFDRFRQADASTTRRHGGLGLGLAIARQLIEMHGGTIRAKSPGEGQGSTFTITLPITVVHSEPPAPAQVSPAEPGIEDETRWNGALTGVKVLVVDDELDARQLIRRVLVNCNAKVSLAASAAEAWAQIELDRPDVIVSDIGMPEEDGYELIRRVRASFTAKQIPAAALTAFARSDDRKRALLAGFQTHIAKPVDPAELTAAIASLACRTGTNDGHRGANSGASAASTDHDGK
jgi:PAS domain S-box-containing protein